MFPKKLPKKEIFTPAVKILPNKATFIPPVKPSDNKNATKKRNFYSTCQIIF